MYLFESVHYVDNRGNTNPGSSLGELEMSETATKTALATLDSLEARLQKVEWYLSDSDGVKDTLREVKAQGQDYTVQARLARLENDLGRLAARSTVVRDLLKLRS